MKKRSIFSLGGVLALSAAIVLFAPKLSSRVVRAGVESDGSVKLDASNFPDAAFRSILADRDKDKDGYLSQKERQAVNRIFISNAECKSIKGIEYFENLDTLTVWNSSISSVDLSKNTALTSIELKVKGMTSLNVSKNTALKILKIHSTAGADEISSLNLKGATALETLDCSNNALSSLDISANNNLKTLNCSYNQFASLDFSNNSTLTEIICGYNPLTSLNCSNMTSLVSLDCTMYSNPLLLKNLNVTGDTKLEVLSCKYLNITALDLSTCTSLKDLDIYRDPYFSAKSDPMTSLDLSNNTLLETVDCTANGLTKLTLPTSTTLSEIQCRNNKLTNLNVKTLSGLTKLDCSSNQLTKLTIGSLKQLTELECQSNALTTLSVSGCSKLSKLNCSYNRSLATLTLPGSGASLKNLTCNYNVLTALDLSKYTALEYLDCSVNAIESLDVSMLKELTYLNCSANKLISLDVSNLGKLKRLFCNYSSSATGTNIGEYSKLKTLNVSGATSLQELEFASNEISSIDLSGLSDLRRLICSGNALVSLQLQDSPLIEEITCSNNELTSIKLGSKENLTELLCYRNKFTTLDLSSAPKLKQLSCHTNNLTSLKVSGDISLEKLNCSSNALTSLDVSNLSSLVELNCYSNKIKTLKLSGVTTIKKLLCYDNQITTLNASKISALRELNCNTNQITQLDVSGAVALETLYCRENAISALDVSHSTSLKELDCAHNQIKTLNLSKNAELKEVECEYNLLESLNIVGATALEELKCTCNQLSSLNLSKSANLSCLECYHNKIYELQLDGAPIILSCVKAYKSKWSTHCYDKEWPFYVYSTSSDHFFADRLECDLYTGLISKSLTPTPTPPPPADDAVMLNSANFPDPNFLEYIINQGFDTNHNGALEKEEIQEVHAISCDNFGIKSMKGLSYFTALQDFCCRNNQLTSLDLSNLTELCGLACEGNQISVINIYSCPRLVKLVENYDRQVSDDGSYHFYYGGVSIDGWRGMVDLFIDPDVEISTVKPTPTPTPVTQKSVEIGKSFQYSIWDIPAESISWSVGNTSVATVDANGKVTGKSIGNTYLHIGLPDGKTIKCLVKVVYPTLSVRYTEKTLYVNQTFQFAVTGASGQKVTWSVGNSSVATVDQNGKVTAKSAANTYLYAKSADGRVAKCLLKVVDPGPLGINYTEKTVYLGQNFTFTAKNAGILTPTWSVGNTAIAKVDSNGKVTSVSAGNTYLYVKTDDGRSARCLVKVVDPGPLSITYTEKTIKVGSSFHFSAKNPAGQTVSWRVGNTAVATVDANGNVTGKSVANTWLYASTPDGREVKCLIKVVS